MSFVVVPIVTFDVPTRSEELTLRRHNRFVKEALRETMLEHHRKHTRKHFQRGNSYRYAMQPRSRKYRERKQRKFGHQIDMLYSGRSRDTIAGTPVKVQIGGAAEGGRKRIRVQYRLRFPFAGGSGASRTDNRVIKQMVDELARWSEDEVRWAINDFHRRYWDKVRQFKAGRRRIRMPKR